MGGGFAFLGDRKPAPVPCPVLRAARFRCALKDFRVASGDAGEKRGDGERESKGGDRGGEHGLPPSGRFLLTTL